MIAIERGDFLWETGDWAAALELRFGWATLPAAVATLTDIVYTNYGLEIQRIERLDFEDVRWGFWVRDLAWATVHLGTLFRDWELVAPATEAAFVVGYTTHRSLIEAEHTILPTLLALDTISLARATNDEAQRRISLERARNLAFTLD